MEVAEQGGSVEILNPIVGNPEVVIGCQHGQAQEYQRTTTDQEGANAGLVDRTEERQFVEVRASHPRRTL
jgi:hypothetical protein